MKSFKKMKLLLLLVFAIANITTITIELLAKDASHEKLISNETLLCPQCGSSNVVDTGGHYSWGYSIYECCDCMYLFFDLPLEDE